MKLWRLAPLLLLAACGQQSAPAPETAGHGAETPYVFRTLDKLAPPTDMRAWGQVVGEADRSYAERVSATWIRFAKSGNPNGEGLPQWPQMTTGHEVTLEFGQQEAQLIENFAPLRMEYMENRFESGKM